MKRRLTGVLVLASLAVAVAAACSSGGRRTAEMLNGDGNRQYAAGDYAGALETYRKAEVLRPDLPALNYNAGNTLNRQSDFVRALQEGQRAVHSTDPAVQDRAYYGMGDAYVRTNQLREALDAYKSALRVNPADIDAKYNLEVIQRRLDLQEARKEQVRDQDPGQDGQQPGADQAGQPQPGQGQQQGSPSDQPGQDGAGQPSSSPSTGSNAASGFTGTPAGRAEALDPALKRALDQFNQTGSVDDALRALDIVAQQERARQAGSGAPAQTQGKDW